MDESMEFHDDNCSAADALVDLTCGWNNRTFVDANCNLVNGERCFDISRSGINEQYFCEYFDRRFNTDISN